MFLVTGTVLTILDIVPTGGAVVIPGVPFLLAVLLHGLGASGCTSADPPGRVARARVRGRPALIPATLTSAGSAAGGFHGRGQFGPRNGPRGLFG